MEDEDEHALQGVEDGEEVGHDDGALVDVHQAEGPGQAQQTQQGYGPDHPGPGGGDASVSNNTEALCNTSLFSFYCPGSEKLLSTWDHEAGESGFARDNLWCQHRVSGRGEKQREVFL